MIKVAIIGATGYTGIEAIEIILRHPQAKLTYLTALPQECGKVQDVFTRLAGVIDMDIEPLDLEKLADKADVALCCLPHKVSMGYVPKLLETGVKVIDFSADYRLKNIDTYEKFYQPHTDPKNIEKAVYGLPEFYREQIISADLVANPGCFPTGAALAIAPLLKNHLIETDDIIVSAVTGVSGGGKNPAPIFHYPNMNENILPYKIGSHRHMPEMEQVASDLAAQKANVLFQPHVAAFDRGIISTVYCNPVDNIKQERLIEIYRQFYMAEKFVKVLKKPPAVKDVAKTNYCHLYPAAAKGKIVCFSAIDNLIKGASGQAVQNMNIIFDTDETYGLI